MDKYFSFTILFLFLGCFVIAQKDWKLNLDKDGIRTYSKTIAGSKIKALRVTCIVEATLSQVATVLLDINTQDEWFYNTKSDLLQQVSPSELYYYSEVSFPFPFSNRDYIAHIKLSQDADTRVLTMTVQNAPDFIPEKHSIIRVRQSACNWVITAAKQDSVFIDFTLFVSPAGDIPSWLVNIFSRKGPYESFKKLKRHLKNPRYINASLPFIKN